MLKAPLVCVVTVKLSVEVVEGFVKFSTVNETAVETSEVLLNPLFIVIVLVAVFIVLQSSTVADGIPLTPLHVNVVLGETVLGYMS